MPFISGGSLQSIMASSYPHGLPEPCIAAVLKPILQALSHLHDSGHLHTDIKTTNILIDSDGSVKLADFGVIASIYEKSPSRTVITGTLAYWVAPEVPYSGYKFESDIWSLGITSLELLHGRPPLSYLPSSSSMIMQYIEMLRFPLHYDETKASRNRKFSKSFTDMIRLCLEHDFTKRPAAAYLLWRHPFFSNCKGPDFLIKKLVRRVRPATDQQRFENVPRLRENEKHGLITGWTLDKEWLEMDPISIIEESERCDGEAVAVLQSMLDYRDSLDLQRRDLLDTFALLGREQLTVVFTREEKLMQEVMSLRKLMEFQMEKIDHLEKQLECMEQQLEEIP